MDILEKIETFFDKTDSDNLSKDQALGILECIIKESPEDGILLSGYKEYVDNMWYSNGNVIKESFKNVLAYYGITSKDNVKRKMVVEKRDNNYIKKYVSLGNIAEISKILDK